MDQEKQLHVTHVGKPSLDSMSESEEKAMAVTLLARVLELVRLQKEAEVIPKE